ncbi:hypothetical protein [Flavilitoribacter nigricans]|uniref:Uncharacterized protein n=1 Tax=Flavilitoribacter nigricans (strain ATCC 23147 / DSM 23189 / NBRC 102662 / NCIMB 1420 / SS-2) TaxID=1122177 RepID=A0A2D0NG23_FLAN2|nr:hypothetical protein [Flavilitoribacter nigricans]PHN07435.1 hypothetical protein CRP01_07355 [Flavilitoribacter nigricans DSM 23189 = NBRC 102662]
MPGDRPENVGKSSFCPFCLHYWTKRKRVGDQGTWRKGEGIALLSFTLSSILLVFTRIFSFCPVVYLSSWSNEKALNDQIVKGF